MPFKPKLVRPDEPLIAGDEEAGLRADLCALAEQLGDDAQYLAGLYPPPEPQSAAPRSSFFRRLLPATAAGVAAVTLGVVGSWNAFGPSTSRPSTAATAPQAVSNDGGNVNPTVTLVDLSGPELEAFFDLTGGQSAASLSVAF